MANPATKVDLINAVYDYYISKGYGQVGASYIVGSLLQESRLDPNAVEKLDGGKIGKGRGLAQWSAGANSWKAAQAYAAKHGLPENDFRAQLEFTRNQNVKVTQEFKDATDAKSGAKAVRDFENFGVEGQRSDSAETIYDNVSHGRPAGQGLGKLVSDDLKDIDGMIEDLNGKFLDQPPGTVCAACQGSDGAQLNVSAKIIPKSGSGN